MSEEGGSDQLNGAQTHAPEAGLNPDAVGAVFISYASQDTTVAEALCAALEREGVACWIAPRNVRPGDFYAGAIVDAISASQMLVLVLSQSAIDSPHVLREVERASAKKRPVITFRIDNASLPSDLEYFLSASQWIDASSGRADRRFSKLAEAIRSRLASTPQAIPEQRRADGTKPKQNLNRPVVAVIAIITLALIYFVADKFWLSKHATTGQHEAAIPTPASPASDASPVFAPPAHSIAVLPFVNMSGDPKQEYFSDGISEELLNALSRLNDLQVVARTSSFSFKGQSVDVSTIAHKLNVGAVLEGSVRRAGNTVRITVQLINAVNGFHMWSQTYDRNLTDILKVQSEVATAVAQQLEIALVGDDSAKLELGGTKNPQAYDAYLRGMQLYDKADTEADYRSVLAAADDATRLDPGYAAAYVLRANSLYRLSDFATNLNARSQLLEQMLAAAQRSVNLAPEFGDAHLALAETRAFGLLDFGAALPEFERALALAPGSVLVQRNVAAFSAAVGHDAAAIAAAHRAVALDPQNVRSHIVEGIVFYIARRFDQALSAFRDAEALHPGSREIAHWRRLSLLASGQIQQGQAECEAATRAGDTAHGCLALVYHALGRQSDAERELAQLRAEDGDVSAYTYAQIYAQWGDKASALQWLATADRLRDPTLQIIKGDWELDPIRGEPQFKAVEARMNFPP